MPINEAQLIGKLQRKQAQDLLRRGLRVQARARLLLSGGTAGHPKRVDTGHLRSSVGVRLVTWRGHPAVRVGTNVYYAKYVRRGTGIYGPYRRPIRPKQAKALVFSSKQYGQKKGKFKGKVVVRQVKGMRKNEFLRDALPAARG